MAVSQLNGFLVLLQHLKGSSQVSISTAQSIPCTAAAPEGQQSGECLYCSINSLYCCSTRSATPRVLSRAQLNSAQLNVRMVY
jgi:hypothetical protein